MLCQLGLERYRGVGIIGFNSPEWFVSDLAAIFAGYDITIACYWVLYEDASNSI